MSAILPFLPIVAVLVALVTSGHVIVNKRDSRAAIGWVGLIWLAPILGTLFYLGFGINRIRRKAQALGRQLERRPADFEGHVVSPTAVGELLHAPHLAQLMSYVSRVVHHPLLKGNQVELLINGDQAFPEMIRAIDEAEYSVALTTYIFDADRVGERIADALGRAVDRGVDVRVLIDGVGSRYSRPPITRLLSRLNVRHARFLPSALPWRFRYLNLRSHRKVLVVDGRLGFTGGMNLREGNLLELDPPAEAPIQDVHARVQGPVVEQLLQVVQEDWAFTTGEVLSGERWFPKPEACGDVCARGIPDGPDENFEEIRLTFLGALATAQERVRIVTPYFLPDASLIAALGVTAMRGVPVDIILPEKGNLALVQWASTAILWQVLERGCRVWYQPGVFSHTKLMTIDNVWTLLGSSNWDPRSYRLNFEFDLECYDRTLTDQADAHIDNVLARSRRVTLEEVDSRPLHKRLLHGSARLLSPYL